MSVSAESADSDWGFTLMELLIAMSLLLVALGMFTGVLWSVQRLGLRTEQLSRATDAAYQSFAEMERQLRSGYIASSTSLGGTGVVDTVRIYTEAYAQSAAASTTSRCAAWVVADLSTGGQGLFTVWWTPGLPGASIPTYVKSSNSFTGFAAGVGIYGWRLITSDILNATSESFQVIDSAVGVDVSQRLTVTLSLREATDPTLLAASPSAWVNTLSTTLTPRNSPRVSMIADTSAFTTSRSALCG